MPPTETRIYIAILTSIIVLLILMGVLIITIIKYQKRKVAFNWKRVEADTNLLEKERARIASDLHDDFGSTLSVIKLKLQCLNQITPDAEVLVTESEMLIDESMTKLRHVSLNLTPQTLKRNGLKAAFEELINKMICPDRYRLSYEYSLNIVDIETGIHIYRIVQEVLNNIVKHAKANAITFNIKTMAKNIELQISDNGIGFDRDLVKNNAGMGINNIAARARLLKAKMYLETGSKGTEYFFKIPVK